MFHFETWCNRRSLLSFMPNCLPDPTVFQARLSSSLVSLPKMFSAFRTSKSLTVRVFRKSFRVLSAMSIMSSRSLWFAFSAKPFASQKFPNKKELGSLKNQLDQVPILENLETGELLEKADQIFFFQKKALRGSDWKSNEVTYFNEDVLDNSKCEPNTSSSSFWASGRTHQLVDQNWERSRFVER